MQILQCWTVAIMMIDAYIQQLVMKILKHPVFFVSSHHCVVIVNVCFCLFWWQASHLQWSFDLKAFEFQQKSRMCCCVTGLVFSDVLSSRARASKNSYSLWTPSPLKMKALDSFKMLGITDPAMECHISEDLNPCPFDL